jgi:hypothetical protein
MVGSVSGGNAPGLMTALMKEATAKQNLEVSVVKKAQDVQKMQGEPALKLIETAGNVSQSGKIDVYA